MSQADEIQDLLSAGLRRLEASKRARPQVALVLGSGLNLVEDGVEGERIGYEELPGFHRPTVSGHRGELVLAEIAGVECMIFSGRPHLYEGTEPWRVGLLPRLAQAAGATAFFVTNAAGAVPGKGLTTGDLMMITDHINLQGRNPLVGPHDPRLGARFPDMGRPYDWDLQALLRARAEQLGLTLKEGVYVGVLGPAYETPAEVRMYGILGADAIGMSTVGEVTVANQIGLKVAGISCISNIAGGNEGAELLAHEDVKEAVGQAGAAIKALIKGCLPGLAEAEAPDRD